MLFVSSDEVRGQPFGFRVQNEVQSGSLGKDCTMNNVV